MRAAALTAIWLSALFSFGLDAAPARVQSGDHADFARLVISVPNGATWRAEKTADQVTLTFEDHEDGFNTAQVFDLIQRNRVSAVSSDGTTVRFDLACACNVVAFEVGTGFVALDIVDPGARLTENFLPQAPNSPTSQAPVTAAVTPTSQRIPTAAAPALPTQAPSALPIRPGPIARDVLSTQEQAVLNDIQNQLAREFGAAATRGTLDPTPGLSLPTSQTNPQIDLSAFGPDLPDVVEPEPRPLPQEIAEGLTNIRISSSMDLPDFARDARGAISVSGAVCPENATLDVANWGDSRPFHVQMSAARRGLFGEFDKLDKDVAIRLAKTYIHFGFGAEAREVLTMEPDLAAEQHMLIAIADIMETGQAQDHPTLSNLLDCDTDVALWAILADETLQVATAIEPSSALLALNKLPVHLRKFLAPALSGRLLAHGDTDAAATALRSLERLPKSLPPAAQLAQANVALDEGRTALGTARLATVIDSNSAQSPEALIALVDAQLKAQQPVSHDIAGLIEAYAKELKGTEIGSELRRAHVFALVKSGQFDKAFEAKLNLGGDSEDAAAVDLRLTLIKELTNAADDVVFLDHMFRQNTQDVVRLPWLDRLALAERYLALGFAGTAQDVIGALPDRPRNARQGVLSARIALELSQPQQAQAALLGLEGEDIDLLRAKAKRMAGEHAQAHQLFQQTNRPDDALQAAWLAEDWRQLTPQNSPVFGPMIALADVDMPQNATTEGMLARSTSALNESQSARQVLEDFLNAPEVRLDAQILTE